MLGLMIKDKIRWHDQWSSELGRRFQIHDFTDNLIIFAEGQSREEILAVLGDASGEVYELLELEDAPPDSCDYMVASAAAIIANPFELRLRHIHFVTFPVMKCFYCFCPL